MIFESTLFIERQTAAVFYNFYMQYNLDVLEINHMAHLPHFTMMNDTSARQCLHVCMCVDC